MTPCTCHPGNTCTSAASCAAARRVEFGENEMPDFVTAIDYADNPSDTTTNLIDVRAPIGTRLALQAQPTPTEHIKEPYTLAELNERIASNDYNAELLLQHAMLLLNAQPAEVSDADIYALWVKHCETPGTTTRQLVCAFARAILAQRPQAVPMTDEQRRTLVGNYFADAWAKRAAHLLLSDYDKHNGITAPAGWEKQA